MEIFEILVGTSHDPGLGYPRFAIGGTDPPNVPVKPPPIPPGALPPPCGCVKSPPPVPVVIANVYEDPASVREVDPSGNSRVLTKDFRIETVYTVDAVSIPDVGVNLVL